MYPEGTIDTVVLVDCRPEQEQLDIFMLTTRLRPLIVSYRRKPTPDFLKAVTKRLLEHAWDGFSP